MVDLYLFQYHYGARYYDPQLCRWLQVDPADEFFSPYLYCHNDPVNFLDPDGEFESHTDAEIAFAVEVLVYYVPYLNKFEKDINSGELTNQETRDIVYKTFGAACLDKTWKQELYLKNKILDEDIIQINNAQKVIKDVYFEDVNGMIAGNANYGKDIALEALSNVSLWTKFAKVFYDFLSMLKLVDAKQFEGVRNELNNDNTGE